MNWEKPKTDLYAAYGNSVVQRVAMATAEGVNQGGQGGGLVSAAGVVEKVAGEGWAPIPENLNEAPFGDHLRERFFYCRSNAYSFQHCRDDEVGVVEG